MATTYYIVREVEDPRWSGARAVEDDQGVLFEAYRDGTWVDDATLVEVFMGGFAYVRETTQEQAEHADQIPV